MFKFNHLAFAGALLVASAAAAAPAPLERAFHPAAWTPLSLEAPPLLAPRGRLVRYDAGEDPAATLDQMLNGPGRATVEAILKEGGAIYVRRAAPEAAFTPDPVLALELACPSPAGCPGTVAYAARSSELVVAGREVTGGWLLTGLAAAHPATTPPRPVDRATDVPHFAIRLPEAVPEPRSWALLIFGFGLVGAAMRRGPILSGQPLPGRSVRRA